MAETLNLEVKSNIKSVTKDTDDLNTSLGKSVDETKDLGTNLKDAGDKGAGGFKKMGTAVKGMGMALKAAGIGLVVALIAKLMEVFSKNQAVMDFFNTAMEALSIAFNDLFGFLSKNVGKVTGWFKELFDDPKQKLIDFGTAIKENLIERFNSFLDTLGYIGEALKHLFAGEFEAAAQSIKDAGKEMVDTFTGVNDSFDKGKKFIQETTKAITKYTKSTLDSAKAIVKLTNAAQIAIAINQGLIEQKDREAELQRQIRDSEKATFKERIAANKELGEILDEQEIAMQKNADLIVAAASAQYNKNKSVENHTLLIEAQNEKEAIAAQIAGLRSEQLVNEESLQKELLETKKELHLATLEGTELELQELEYAYELKLEMARKAGEDTLAIERSYWDQVLDIVLAVDAAEQAIKDAASKKDKDRDKAVMNAKVDMAQNTLGAMAALAGENEAAGKAIAVAQTIFATQQAIMSALAGGGPDNALPYYIKLANAISAGIMGAVAIKNILSTSSATSGGGGGGAAAAPPSPQMMSGSFDLGAGEEIEPTRAYVVSDDITESQNGLAIIRRRATI
tara:strand:+ start:157 stop:1860 length:1704 start_codon:yes stop_codon:yes gene_type:complete